MPTGSSDASMGASSASKPAPSAEAARPHKPWHYVPVPARRPRAPRNGAPFGHWVQPAAFERTSRKLRAAPDGDRRMMEVLGAEPINGLPAVEPARAEALNEGVRSADDNPDNLQSSGRSVRSLPKRSGR